MPLTASTLKKKKKGLAHGVLLVLWGLEKLCFVITFFLLFLSASGGISSRLASPVKVRLGGFEFGLDRIRIRLGQEKVLFGEQACVIEIDSSGRLVEICKWPVDSKPVLLFAPLHSENRFLCKVWAWERRDHMARLPFLLVRRLCACSQCRDVASGHTRCWVPSRPCLLCSAVHIADDNGGWASVIPRTRLRVRFIATVSGCNCGVGEILKK